MLLASSTLLLIVGRRKINTGGKNGENGISESGIIFVGGRWHDMVQ